MKKNPHSKPTAQRMQRIAAGLLLAGTLSTSAADRWWDGGTVNIATAGDGASAGTAGTWNTTIQNWDQGSGFAHVAWNNTPNDTAVFAGTSGTVTLGVPVTANALLFNVSNYTLSGSTLTFAGSAPRIVNSGTTTINSAVAGTDGLSKTGAGTLTLRGTATHALSGGVTVNGGIVELDFLNFTTPTDLLGSGNSAALGGGTLRVKGKTTGTSNQTLNGVTLNGGASGVSTNSNGGTGNFTLGAITRNPGASVNFTLPVLGAITTTSSTSNGILGTWASTGSAASTKYATLGGSNVAALTGSAAADGSALTDVTGTANYDLAAGGGTVPASLAANTIRYTGIAGTTAPGATLFSVNGLMNAGTGLWTIGSGSVTISQDQELVIHAANNSITVSGVIKDNSAGSSAVTIIGTGANLVTLGTANTYTGTTTINGTSAYADSAKTLIVTSLKNTGTASEFGAGSSLVLNGAVVQTSATGTGDRAITLTGTSGFYVKGSITQTLAGPISGPGNLSVDGDYNGGVPGGTGNLALAADNSFTGDVVFQVDSRLTLNHVNAVKNATLNLSGARALADLTTYDLDYVIGGLKGSANMDLGSGNVSIGNNGQSTAYTGILSGAGSLTKIGNGNLTLTAANTYSGNTTVNGGLLVTGSNALPDTTKLTINGGKVAPTGIEIIDTLYFGAVQQAAGTWGATGSGADHIDDARFAGTVGVIKVQPWSIATSALAFGDVTLNDTTTMSLTITNLGSTPISGSASVNGAPYAVTSGASWSVSVGGTTTVTVSFQPTATGSFPDTLTLIGGGLTRIVSLSGNGVSFVPPTATNFQNYAFGETGTMPVVASSANLTLAEGASFTQSFIPRRDNFLTQFSARDGAAPTSCVLNTVSIKSNDYQSSQSTLRFEVLSGSTVIASQDIYKALIGSSIHACTFASPATLNFDATYQLRVTLVVCGARTYGGPAAIHPYSPSTDYADGTLGGGGDLWFDGSGTAAIPVYPQLTIAGDAANRFFYDGDPLNADSSQYDNLRGKFLGIGGAADRLIFTHPAQWGPLTFEMEGGTYASAAAAGHSGTADKADLSGLAEGKAMLWVKSGSTVVAYIKLQVFPQRTITLSYSYIQFPGESNHWLKTPATANAIMDFISSIYAKANIAIDWTDNGVLTHEWDYNSDGNSYTEDRVELWSPMDAGVIPNQSSVFSNLYMIRYDKNDNTIAGSGGGSSRGLGPATPPDPTSGYAGHVRCSLNRSVESLASTLAHELGHNLGLWHSGYSNNIMYVGGVIDDLSGPQWDAIHSTAQAITPPPSAPTINTTPAPGTGTDAAAYSHTFTATGGTPAYTWTLDSGTLPPGLTLSGATLSGNPTTAGNYNFTLRVTDSLSATSSAPFSISITHVNYAPAFTADPINQAATEDVALSSQLQATDPNLGDALSYTKISGPAWLTVSSTGALSGTPGNSNVGVNAFVVRVTDNLGIYDEAALNITVANVNDAPVFASNPINLSATEDATFTGQLSASDEDTGTTLTYSKVSGPAWLTVSSNGALSGTPTNSEVGANAFVVQVSDGTANVTAALNITVSNVNDAPVFTADPILMGGGSVDAAYTGQTLAGLAVDADGDSVSYSKVSGPAWLSVATDGTLSGTPTSGNLGINTFMVRVTDGSSATDDAELRITVTSLPLPWTSSDIGTGQLVGSASYNAGTFTIAGAGAITSSSDKFQFAYQSLSGDGEIVAKVASLQNTGNFTRVGVMIRDSLAANSTFAFMGLDGNGSYKWLRRTSTGGGTTVTSSGNGTVPNTWVRIVRSGNTITSYKSSNGSSWTSVGSVTVTMASNIYIGLAVCSGADNTLNTSQFSNLSVTP